jgi:hypothetical protein
MKIPAHHTAIIKLGRPVERSNIARIFPIGVQMQPLGQATRGVVLVDGPYQSYGYLTSHADSGELSYRTRTPKAPCVTS